jgi:hypothetical protein
MSAAKTIMPAETIGISTTDRLLGILIERTEALREDTIELSRATGDLKTVSGEMRAMLQGMADRLATVERSPVSDAMGRIADCEAGVRDWRAWKDNASKWAFRIAGAAVVLGLGGGTLAKVLFNL